MRNRPGYPWFLAAAVLWTAARSSAHEPPPLEAPPPSASAPGTAASSGIEELVRRARPSVVVITFADRDGKQLGLGSGFVISSDGLIATNLHVLGEARPITVQTHDGRKFDVTEVHASEPSLDLAVVRIAARNLPPLPLGDSDTLQQGQAVVALGNPRGLEHSVVRGVVSGRREIDGKPMIQLAIPIEPGNSGGPLLDLQGRVQGILTLKSAVTQNLGFAVEINALRPLLLKPNPIRMDRWLTIGALDRRDWETHLGARWRQRAGRIMVEEPGTGFGGRSFCLSKLPLPELPYEVAVSVRLDDESGAAGLVFAGDAQRHYGFYPTGGQLRLTRFEGPDVSSWRVLATVPSRHYRPGDWNTLKVRVEAERIACFVNDELVLTANDAAFRGQAAGLAKFRDTVAVFRGFRIGKELPPSQVPPAVADEIRRLAGSLDDAFPLDAAAGQFAQHAQHAATVLDEEARRLEARAQRLRTLAQEIHARRVTALLVAAVQRPDEQIDLLRAGLLVALLDNAEVDVDAYVQQVDRLAADIQSQLPPEADAAARFRMLNQVLFQQMGFHGSRTDYYSRHNSYLNEVLDDREGLPITLSILYMELAARLGLQVVGVGLPGHFVVRYEPPDGPAQLVDVFGGGKLLSRQDADELVQGFTGQPLRDEHLRAADKRSIVLRMLQNLKEVARRRQDAAAMLRYVETLVAIDPHDGVDRLLRAYLRAAVAHRIEAARDDLQWLQEHMPPDVDPVQIEQVRVLIDRIERSGGP
jgi:regulator of sirC expression with transglutaminase-like and TPR domain